MTKGEIFEVDPRNLRLPWSRRSGADPEKLKRHMMRFGEDTDGMPLLEVTECQNGELMINDGVTRAARVARFLPGKKVRVLVIDYRTKVDLKKLPKLEETL